MEQVIQFRSIVNTFDNDEFNLFTTKLFNVYDKRSLLIQSLFFILLNQSKHNKYHHIQQINKICKSITDLRRKRLNHKLKEECKDNKTKPNHFNKLASINISHIAAYLKISEQSQFMQCNRYIFISCSSTPSTIQTLSPSSWLTKYCNNHGPQFRKYQIPKLSKFRMAKEVTFPDINVMSSQYFGQNGRFWKWDNLNSLNIETVTFELLHLGFFANIMRRRDIKRLQFKKISIGDNQPDILLNCLTTNQNIEFLQVGKITAANNNSFTYNADVIKQKLKNLKGFGFWSTGRLPDQLLASVSKQLQGLHLYCSTAYTMPLSSSNDVHYNNLEELCIIKMNNLIVSNILKTAHNLKRIVWQFAAGQLLRYEMNTEHQKIILQHILCQSVKLEYLRISTSFRSQIFEWINEAFTKCTIKRKNIKLRIYFSDVLDNNSLKFVEENIEEMADIIKKCVTNDFFFDLGIPINIENNNGFKGIRKKLQNMKSVYSIKINSAKFNVDHLERFYSIKVTNINNSMCGYDETWMFQCAQPLKF